MGRTADAGSGYRWALLGRALTVLLLGVCLGRSEPARAGPAAGVETSAADGDTESTPPSATAPDPATEPTTALETDPAVSKALVLRASRIRQLIAGTLPTDIEPSTLFVLDLAGLEGGVQSWDALLLGIEGATASEDETGSHPKPKPAGGPEAGKPDPAADPPADAGDVQAATRQLLEAWAEYFALPRERREAILRQHAQRRQAERDQAQAQERAQARLKALRGQADRLEAFLAGELDPQHDPHDLLEIDLLGRAEVTSSPARRKRALQGGSGAEPSAGERTEGEGTPEAETDAEPDPVPAPLEAELAAAEDRLDVLRRRFLSLTKPERRALFEAHQQARAAAEAQPLPTEPVVQDDPEQVETEEAISSAESAAAEAAADRERALEAARLARTEAMRRVAEERARLLGIKERQALYAAEISRRKQAARRIHEAALEWNRKVTQLLQSAEPAADIQARADPMYLELRETLTEARGELGQTLDGLASPGEGVPRPATGLERVRDEVEELEALRAELDAAAEDLIARELADGWDSAKSLRDDVVMLNADRLSLLGIASPRLRSRMTRLGAEGFDQVRRELDQIALELRYHAMSLPTTLRELRGAFARDPVGVLGDVIGVLVVIVVFRWWRKHADEALRRAYTRLRGPRTGRPSLGQRMGRQVIWYTRHVRKPVEWLALVVALPYVSDVLQVAPELRLLWIVALWWFGGSSVILLVDAVAERQSYLRFHKSETAQLRFRSLRLLGITVTVIGLILHLTAAVVGRGAIYDWVFDLCWLLAAPIAVWLVRSWRGVIFGRIEALPAKGPLLEKIVAHRSGPRGFMAALAGGLYLLGVGLRRYAVRQAGQLDTTRKLLAYLFRREVAKQAEARSHKNRLRERIDAQAHPALDPQSEPEPLLEAVARERVGDAVRLTEAKTTTLTAVVGERGMGKTTFLGRVVARSTETTCVLDCPPAGFDALLEALAEQFKATAPTEEAVAVAIAQAGPSIVCIDDAQRMIEPTIGGLADLDRFTRFALRVGGDVSWIVAIDDAAWEYVSRARGDRVFFDQVIDLPRWTEPQIADLIRKRTHAAGLHPMFEELVVVGQLDDPGGDIRERSELGYYRILWDHSKGNPAVALQAWSESLFVSENPERPVVQLFEEPSPKAIEKLPLTLLFVLRSIVQLDLASPDEIASCTQLPAADVADAIRFSITHGFVERVQDRVRLSWHWYRTITLVLVRKHLLVA